MPTQKTTPSAKTGMKKPSLTKKSGKSTSTISGKQEKSTDALAGTFADAFAGIGNETVLAKTGKRWSAWLTILDKKASSLSHKEMAKFLHEKYQTSPWWSQMITVGYEQARGLREKHQTTMGYQVSASKTVNLPIEELFSIWNNSQERTWLMGSSVTVRKSTPNKALRIDWQEPKSKVDIDFYEKGKSKTQVVISHTKLPSSKDVQQYRTFWKEALNRIVVK